MAIQENVQYLITYVHDKSGARGVIATQNQITQGNKRMGLSFTSMAKRAFQVIPIWLLLRGAYMAVFNTIRMGTKHIVDFDKAMARALAVTHGVKDTVVFMRQLRNEIQELAIETGVSVDKIAEAYYRFGTAGLAASIAQEGMKISLKTSIAIMGDATETARTIADVYNLMKDNIKGATTVQEKLQKIGSSMAVLWRNNAFELSEFNQALRTFTGTAKTTNLNLDEMMSLLAASHTLMQRGGTAGNQLSRTFMMMTKRVDAVNMVLGRQVDLHKERIFDVYLELLKKINREYGDSAAKLSVLTQIFGMKGFKVTGAFASNLGKVVEELQRLKDLPLNERMIELNKLFEIQQDTVQRHINTMGELRKLMGVAFIKGLTGAEDFKEALKEINRTLEDMIPLARDLGEVLNFLATPIKIMIEMKKIQGIYGAEADALERTNRLLKERQQMLSRIAAQQKVPSISREEAMRTAQQEGASSLAVIDSESLITKSYQRIPKAPGATGKSPEELAKAQATEEDKINMALNKRFDILNRLQIYGMTSLAIEKEKLRILSTEFPERLKEIARQEQKVLDLMTKELVKFSETLRTSFTEGFEGLLKAEIGVGEFFSNIGTTIKDTLIRELSDVFSRKLFEKTGLGDIFSRQASAIRNAGEYNAQIWYKAITGAAGGGGAGRYSGAGGYPTSTAVDIGGGNYQTVGGYPGGQGPAGYRDPKAGGKGKFTAKQKAAGGIASAMAGYSSYQSSIASGASQGRAVGAAALSTIGTGLMMFGGPVGMVVGGIMQLGSALLGSGGGASSRSVEIKENTKQVSSRIDISNRHLEWVNRNLVAMRQEITFIMQQSYYFRERNETEAFAIGSQRGSA